MKAELKRNKFISPGDLDLVKITDDREEAIDIILRLRTPRRPARRAAQGVCVNLAPGFMDDWIHGLVKGVIAPAPFIH